jgi:hypothetical protein
VVGGAEEGAGGFDSFFMVREGFSPCGPDVEMERRRAVAVVTGGVEFDRLVWRARGADTLLPGFSSFSIAEPETCQLLRGSSGVGGMALLDLSEPRESVLWTSFRFPR